MPEVIDNPNIDDLSIDVEAVERMLTDIDAHLSNLAELSQSGRKLVDAEEAGSMASSILGLAATGGPTIFDGLTGLWAEFGESDTTVPIARLTDALLDSRLLLTH